MAQRDARGKIGERGGFNGGGSRPQTTIHTSPRSVRPSRLQSHPTGPALPTMVSFGKEARIITLLVIDVVFFLVEIIVGEWRAARKDCADLGRIG